MSEIEWGTFGEWLSGLGAIAVVAVTLALWRAEVRRGSHRGDLEAASKVNAWFQIEPDPNVGYTPWAMKVENSGAETIYEWDAAVWWARMGEPGGGPHIETIVMSSANEGPLFPGARFSRNLAWPSPAGAQFAALRPAQELRVAIIWRDPRGDVWWARFAGRLMRSSERWPQPWAISPGAPQLPDLDQLALVALRPPRRGWRRRG